MITKINRFHGHNSLNYVYKNGKTIRSEFISLRYASSRRPDYRLAVVVSKKVHKSAVVRNRIRRRVYEVARLYDITGSSDFVLSVFDERVATMSADELTQTLHKLFHKANINS